LQLGEVLNLKTLTVDEVCRIHYALVEEFAASDNPISPPGVKSQTMLESAVSRQHTGSGGRLKYPEPLTNAATLAYGLCCDHPFHNGNKRTALVALLVHLDRNKLTLFDVRQADLYHLVLAIATHTVIDVTKRKPKLTKSNRIDPDDEVREIAEWLRDRASPITRGERQITYRQLGRILTRFELSLEAPKGNYIEIAKYTEKRAGFFTRKTKQVRIHIGTISYRGEHEFVPIKDIKYLRNKCHLREEDGVTSDAFYSEGAIIDSFINKYRTILRKLANK
jgi:prophage maintenance system killer protein